MPVEFLETRLFDVFEIRSQAFLDHRGSFVNAFRLHNPVFRQVWGDREITQVNFSCTYTVGSIRGMHMQSSFHSEAKLVRCVRGRVWDVAVDLRQDSNTRGQWHAAELSPDQGNALFIPEGCAHGFQALEPGSELLYLHSGKWEPDAETGVRWDDPLLAIAWPLPLTDISDRDRSLPFFLP